MRARTAAGTGLGVILAAGLASAASAEDLIIGLASDITSVDPHFHNLGPNNAFGQHVFDRLINQGPNQELEPGLATEWQAVDETTWEFKIRDGITFHSGAPLTAEDIKFTFDRLTQEGAMGGQTSPRKSLLGPLTSVEIKDDHTVLFKLSDPWPILPPMLP
ncbi:MAG TPA: ABC transporter substrate-binding protein, partial [Geminicoccaceae bacterium]